MQVISRRAHRHANNGRDTKNEAKKGKKEDQLITGRRENDGEGEGRTAGKNEEKRSRATKVGTREKGKTSLGGPGTQIRKVDLI